MKKRVPFLIAAALLCAMLLPGCGGSAPAPVPTATTAPTEEPTPEPLPTPDPAVLEQMRREDAAIRAAMENEEFGFGDKLALYDEKEDLYFFHGAWLPDGLRAGTLEEIGGFLGYCYDLSVEGMPEDVAAKLGSLVSDVCLMEPNGKVWATANIGGLLQEYVDGTTKAKYSSQGTRKEGLLGDWIETVFPSMQDDYRKAVENQNKWQSLNALLDSLNDPSQTVEFTDGRLFVGYDEDAGEYTMDRIPENLRSWDVDEVGFILSYRSVWGTEGAQYEKQGWVEVPVETFTARVLIASTGQTLDTFTISMHAPTLLNMALIQQPVTSGYVEGKLRDVFQAHGLEWPA